MVGGPESKPVIGRDTDERGGWYSTFLAGMSDMQGESGKMYILRK